MELLRPGLRRHGTLLLLLLLVAPSIHAKQSLGKLLEMSDPARQSEWGARYEHGEGVEQNIGWAIRLYCSAARKGHAAAQYNLGWLYANGRGIERDDALAAAWFRLAARKGDQQAKRMLEVVAAGTARKKARCKLPDVGNVRLARVSAAERQRISAMVRELAPRYELEPELVLALIEAESGFDAKARSSKNAQGLMQLIPATAERFGVRNAMDPRQNLKGGMAYLRWLLAYFRGDLKLALAGYNAGEGNVEKYRGIPPFSETRTYVAYIIRRFGRDTHPPVTQIVTPSALLAAR